MSKTSWHHVLRNPSRWWEAIVYASKVFQFPTIGAADRPDPRDFSAGTPSGKAKLPKKFSLYDKAVKLGWEPTKQSKNSCTAYSKGHGVEITNTIEHQKPVGIEKELQWTYQLATGGSKEYGDYVQNAEKQFHKNPQGFKQTEYFRLRSKTNTVRGIKLWLLKNETIRTGVYWKWVPKERDTNSGVMMDTGFFSPGEGRVLGGHACLFTGWDDTMKNPDGSVGAFQLLESEKMLWGENPPGIFWVSYKDLARLFSKYISRDTIDLK